MTEAARNEASNASPPNAGSWPRRRWRAFTLWLRGKMPKGLFARSLLIVVLPMALLQILLAYVFMERHWQRVTHRLSADLANEVSFLADMHEADPNSAALLTRLAWPRLGVELQFDPPGPLPTASPKPFFSLLDHVLAQELDRRVGRPYWIDTIGASDLIDIRVQLRNAQMRVYAHRSQAYASNSSIFIMWMVGASAILLLLAILFLKNQIRPIRRLAAAAQAFGRGQDAPYRPSGAREVRQAGLAFVEMKRRIARANEQRMAMLNGVSHDLRTMLTRFRLSLELLEDGPERRALQRDAEDMQKMLESYLSFAKADAEEEASAPVALAPLLDELLAGAGRDGVQTSLECPADLVVRARPEALRRCLANLVDNAARHGRRVVARAAREDGRVAICIDDDGAGIAPDQREAAFKPFNRLDDGRNVDAGGVGLGLAIARDAARAHGGDVALESAPLGGLRAVVSLPQ